ncbi:MAG: L-threonylcarbamoyladenylate synthase [Pseudomonadota bacterium]
MHNPKKIICIDPVNPEPVIIAKAGKILAQNGVVIFPAKCLYGVAVHAFNTQAVEQVFQLKNRPRSNPILILVKDRAMLNTLVTHIPDSANLLMDAFWPGNLTLVFNAQDHIPEQLTAGTEKIGIRIPVHPVAQALVQQVNFPITGTSANLTGEKGCTRIDQLAISIIDQSDLILDAGPVKGGKGSTIADVTEETVRILREGEISGKQIKKALA